MNKNIKRIIALVLSVNAFCTISAITPGTSFDITTKAAYADSYSPNTGELKTLKVKSTNGDTLDLHEESYNGDTVKLNDDKDYYVKLTDDSEGIKINADVKGEDYIVKIFTSDDEEATEYNPGDKIELGKGDVTIYVRTYESLSDYRKAKNTNKDVTQCKEEYKINVRKTKGSSSDDTTQDAIYLSKLELNKGDISFSKQRTSYDVKVDEDVSEIKITAKPEDESDRVRIDGSLIDSSDNYKKTISLDDGKNEIKIKVTDDKDNQRTYTLNVTRGKDDGQGSIYLDDLTISEGDIDFSKTDSEYTVDLDESVDSIKIGAEPEDDGYVVTIDGKEVNSSDDYERKVSLNKGKNKIKVVIQDELNDKERTYTLTVNRGKETEEVKTTENNNTTNTTTTTTTDVVNDKKAGWVQASNGWQYNDKDGNKMTGWVIDNGVWYYLDSNGAMQSGLVTIGNEKYYLNPDSNGTKGAMVTGWVSINGNWYYFNEDSDGTKGAMKTSWVNSGKKWYYLNKDGSMQKGWIVDSNSKYYLDNNGVMVTGTQTIDGKQYKFTSSGVLII